MMKKITLLLMLSFLNLTAWSQNPNYRYHELQDLGTTIEWAISIECTHHFEPLRVLDVNLRQNFKLEVGKIYKVDLGLSGNYGTRYYKVTYAGDTGTDKGDELDTPPNFGAPITDLCNSLSWKFIRPVLLGSTLEEAQSNFCSSVTKNTVDEKVNIKTTTPLNVGQVYFMDFGKGANYYVINGSSSENGDADYEFDPTINNAIFNPITFNCQKVDFKAISISTNRSSTNVYRQESIRFSYLISQIGSRVQSTTTHIRLYLTKSRNFINSNDFYLQDNILSVAKANEYYGYPYGQIDAPLVIPNLITNGKYYITIAISNSEDFNSLNNIISTSGTINVIDGSAPTTPTIPTTPPTPIGTSDLTIDPSNVIVNSECNCNSTLSDLGGKRHRLSNTNGSIRVPSMMIKNIGNGTSIPTDLKLYLSKDATLDTSDFPSNQNVKSISSINPKESYVIFGGEIFSYDFGNGAKFKDDWNILMVVDDSKKNTESNENNNVTAIPVTFYDPTVPMARVGTENTEPYVVNVYNFEGQKVFTKEVNSKEEENKSIDSLKTGLYIIKSKGETRKVLKK